MSWKPLFDWIVIILKKLLGLPFAMDILKRAYAMIFEYFAKKRTDRIKADREGMKEAIAELKRAETEEEFNAAVEKIGEYL